MTEGLPHTRNLILDKPSVVEYTRVVESHGRISHRRKYRTIAP